MTIGHLSAAWKWAEGESDLALQAGKCSPGAVKVVIGFRLQIRFGYGRRCKARRSGGQWEAGGAKGGAFWGVGGVRVGV